MKHILAIAILCIGVFFSDSLLAQGWIGSKQKSQEDSQPGPYVQEQNSQYRQHMVKIQKLIEDDKNTNFKNMLIWKHLDKMEEDIRRAAEMMAKMQKLDQLVTLLQLGGKQGATWNYQKTQPISDDNYFNNPNADGDTSKIKLNKEYLTVKNSKVLVPDLIMDPPVWVPPETSASFRTPVYWGRIIKVASSKKQIGNFEGMLREISTTCLPDVAINQFNPRKAAQWLMRTSGIVQKGSGIITRPAAPQDSTFRNFANLGCSDTSQTLFWSDTSVLNGYSAFFGTTLNKTMLRGYKTVDMDDAVSQGESAEIDKQNRIRPRNEQLPNPYRGAASQTLPGLITLGKQGRLADGEPITDDQLREAFKITKKLDMLPSQKSPALARNTNFSFSYPPRIIRVQDSASSTSVVPMPEFELEIFKRSMMMARDRLIDIQRLMNANRLSRQYVNEIVEALKRLIGEADAVATYIQGLRDNGFSVFNKGDFVGDSPDGSIPEITMFRQSVLADIEYQRTVLSKLEHQYDDLKQKEWIILDHILDTRKKAVQSLMSEASVRYNTEQQNADEGSSTGTSDDTTGT